MIKSNCKPRNYSQGEKSTWELMKGGKQRAECYNAFENLMHQILPNSHQENKHTPFDH